MSEQPNDPIVAQVRAVRAEHAAKFNYDVKAIFQDLIERQWTSGRKYARYPSRPAVETNRPVKLN